MKFKNNFQKREYLGRQAVKELKQLHPDKFKYDLEETGDTFSPYDMYYYTEDKKVLLEVKIRDKDFDTFILEVKKLEALQKIKSESNEEIVLLYLNFTPTKTIIWNITNIDSSNSKTIIANKTTEISRNCKVEKEVIYLNPKDGYILDYVLDEDKLLM